MFPHGLLEMQERFPDLHPAVFDMPNGGITGPPVRVEGMAGRCPSVHEGDTEGTFHAVSTDLGYCIIGCDQGCSPAEVWNFGGSIDAREAIGSDDDDPRPVEAAAPAGLERYAIPGGVEHLKSPPPRREYLLSVASSGVGVLARGQVGMIAARGGTGKSNALMQLGVSVATGGTWFGPGRGWSARMGRALMLFAEEDREEVERRRFYALRAAGIISNTDLQMVADNLVLMPMRGLGVELAGQLEKGILPISARAIEIQAYLRREAKAGRPFILVGLDPLSRFAGADVEIDNHAATRFVEVCETFTAENCGRPNVTLAHHSKKIAKDIDPETPDVIRGASGLVDAVRWAAVMTRKKELVRFKVVKTNYATEPEPLMLTKVDGCHGALEAVEAEIGAPSADKLTVDPGLMEEVYNAVVKTPDSGSGLARRLHRNHAEVLQACSDLFQAGRIARKGKVWIGSSGSAPVPGNR